METKQLILSTDQREGIPEDDLKLIDEQVEVMLKLEAELLQVKKDTAAILNFHGRMDIVKIQKELYNL